MMTPTPTSTSLRDRFAALFGGASTGVQTMIDVDPEFAAAFIGFTESAAVAPTLEPAIRELLLLAHDVSITNLDKVGAAHRVVKALEAGATPGQVIRVIELVTMVSLHGLTRGFRILAGPDPAHRAPPVAESRGYWRAFDQAFPGFHAELHASNPGVYEAYKSMGSLLWRDDELDPKWAELAFVVADLANTHLFTEGAAFHIKNALHYGATREQVVDAIFLTVPSVVRSAEVGFDAVRAGFEEHARIAQSSASTPR